MNTNEKLREALDEISLLLQATSDVMCKEDKDKIELALDLCNTALALPRRNCDVGTAEEQHNRFVYCCSARKIPCLQSYTKGCSECFAKWAQMPYEEVKEC